MSTQLVVGEIVGGRYVVKSLVGAGGMGAVYHAYDTELDLDVALKVLKTDLAIDPSIVAQFRGEGRVEAQLNHPHVLRLFTNGEVHGTDTYYLVLEYLTGGTLRDRMTGAPWPLEQALPILTSVGSALAYAHAHVPPVVHLDLKPGNILFDAAGRLVVGDFGLARLLRGAPTLSAGRVMGTPAYMAPEQARGGMVGILADVYALGVIAYELLVGRAPFQGDSPVDTMTKVMTLPPSRPSDINPLLSHEIDEVLLRMLAKDPAERFESATAFVEALASAAASERSAQRGRMAWRLIAGGVAALALAAVAIIGGGVYLSLPHASAPSASAAQASEFTALVTPSPTSAPPATAPPATATASPTASPSITPRPSTEATLTTDQEWQGVLAALDPLWSADWPRAIALLDAFRARHPEHAVARAKLYAARIFYAGTFLDGSDVDRAIEQLEQARAVDPDAAPARATLEALTPTPIPTRRPAPTPLIPTTTPIPRTATAIATKTIFQPTPAPTKSTFTPPGQR